MTTSDTEIFLLIKTERNLRRNYKINQDLPVW